MYDTNLIKDSKLSEITTTQIWSDLKEEGFMFPRRKSSRHVNTQRNYLRIIEKLYPNINTIRTSKGKIWYIKGNEQKLLTELYPSLFGIINHNKAISIIKKSSIDSFKMDYLFRLLNDKKYLSLKEIMEILKCTKSMACSYTKTMQEISNSLDYKMIGNKKYIYKKEIGNEINLLKNREHLDNINLSKLLSDLRALLGFSVKDFSTLLDIDTNTYPHYEREDHPVPKDILEKISGVIREIATIGKRKAIFKARMRNNLKDELLLLRGIRLKLELSTKELTKLTGNEADNLNNLERGFISNSKEFREKIINILKQTAKKRNIPWKKILKNVEEFKKSEKQRWLDASKHEKIIDLRIPRGTGVSFEKEILKLIKKQNFFNEVISNAILADKEYKTKTDADIYAVKKFPNNLLYDVIFECKSRKSRHSIGTKGMIGFARELATIKNILDIKEAIIITDVKFSNNLERNIKALGIQILYKKDLEGFFNEKQHMDRTF